jgi:hypothetical protein
MPQLYQSVQAGLNPTPTVGAAQQGAAYGQVQGFQNQQQGSGMFSNITNALGLQAGGKKKPPKSKPKSKKGGEKQEKQEKQEQDGGKKKAKPKPTSPKRTTSPKRKPAPKKK